MKYLWYSSVDVNSGCIWNTGFNKKNKNIFDLDLCIFSLI